MSALDKLKQRLSTEGGAVEAPAPADRDLPPPPPPQRLQQERPVGAPAAAAATLSIHQALAELAPLSLATHRHTILLHLIYVLSHDQQYIYAESEAYGGRKNVDMLVGYLQASFALGDAAMVRATCRVLERLVRPHLHTHVPRFSPS